jgi:large subunit ribosomal protein L23
MALFSSKKKEEKKDVAPKAEAKSTVKAQSAKPKAGISRASASLARVLVRPRITEKAANMTAVNVYTFDIAKSATKKQVIDAVKALYKVTPVKVNVVNTPAKRVRKRRTRGFGTTAATRKAYVYLKKGQEIQFA